MRMSKNSKMKSKSLKIEKVFKIGSISLLHLAQGLKKLRKYSDSKLFYDTFCPMIFGDAIRGTVERRMYTLFLVIEIK